MSGQVDKYKRVWTLTMYNSSWPLSSHILVINDAGFLMRPSSYRRKTYRILHEWSGFIEFIDKYKMVWTVTM